jgi:mannose-6-phosphate isomerase-like protein (cupin superfamily)
VSNDKIHQLLFGLPPRGNFRHSEEFRTIFGADEVLYVLSGEMLLINPEHGEVHRVRKDEAVFFRKDTWHHAFAYGEEPLRVLEYFSPPPSTGTSGAYARTKPNLTAPRYANNEHLGRWPMARSEIAQGFTMQMVREADYLWRYEGESHRMLVGLLASTEHMTVGKLYLRPGERSDLEVHGGDEGLYLLEGTLHIHCPEREGQSWFELTPQDGFYLPAGAPHQYYNMSEQPVTALFCVAPNYLAA